MGQAAGDLDHRGGHPPPPDARRQQTGQLRRGEPGEPPAARGRRRRRVAPGARRRGHRMCGHRSRPARRAREVRGVLRGASRHAGLADRTVGGGADDGGARTVHLVRRRPGDERKPGAHRGAARSGPAAWRGGAGQPDRGRPRSQVDGRRIGSGQQVGQPPVRTDEPARHGDGDAAAREAHRAGREVPGMNSGTLVGSLIFAAFVVVLIAVVIQLMMRAWQRRARQQAELIGALPDVPELLGAASITTPGMYVGCTMAPAWGERITAGDLGYRSKAVLSMHPKGILVQRIRALPIWIPKESISAIRTERGIAGKVAARNGILAIRWRLPSGVKIDTGFRADNRDEYESWLHSWPEGVAP